MSKRQPAPNLARDSKIRQISQAHVGLHMSLTIWQAILGRHGVPLTGDPWSTIPETTLDAIIADIRAVSSPSVPLPLGGVRGGLASI